jgi:hypothetical protein
MSTLMRRLAAVATAVAMVVMFPITANAADSAESGNYAATTMAVAGETGTLIGDTHGDHADAKAPQAGQKAGVQATWQYHIQSSCGGYEAAIERGANYWGGGTRTASSGTPVGCTGGYVSGCGGSNVVGCNWGQGDRIMLSTMVSDFALLAAHEFGHNWYGHSASGCASWASPSDVMKTTMC